MGTRSVVAIPDPERRWRGRYVHWDGYPTGVGEALRTIVARDGHRAVAVLIEEHYGWSSIDAREEQELGTGMQDGRFAVVPGYGVAYTTETGGIPGGVPQSSPDDWHYGDDAEGSWCEWAYVIGEAEGAISVYRPAGAAWIRVGEVALGDPEGMAAVEKAVYGGEG